MPYERNLDALLRSSVGQSAALSQSCLSPRREFCDVYLSPLGAFQWREVEIRFDLVGAMLQSRLIFEFRPHGCGDGPVGRRTRSAGQSLYGELPDLTARWDRFDAFNNLEDHVVNPGVSFTGRYIFEKPPVFSVLYGLPWFQVLKGSKRLQLKRT